MIDLGTRPGNDEFGNSYSISLTGKDYYDNVSGECPVQAFGVHGLIEYNGDIHLLGEDDGHYWTDAILTMDEIAELYTLATEAYKMLKSDGTRWHKWFEEDLPSTDNYETSYVNRDEDGALITFVVKGKELCFDVGWLDSFIKTLDINPLT